jgi:hypothetical protein
VSRAPLLRVEGARQLRASLRSAGLSLDDLRKAHLAVAQLVDRAAKPNAPVDKGRLAASERPAGTQSAAIVRAGSARVPYAGPIHWGWPNRHIVANPWLYDAAANTETAWLALYLRAIEAVLHTIEGAESD